LPAGSHHPHSISPNALKTMRKIIQEAVQAALFFGLVLYIVGLHWMSPWIYALYGLFCLVLPLLYVVDGRSKLKKKAGFEELGIDWGGLSLVLLFGTLPERAGGLRCGNQG
jgi:hypothetical protein